MYIAYKVIWTGEALKNLQTILKHLADNWSAREIDQFLETIKNREILLSQQPRAFPRSEKAKGYRRSVLSSQITIYYKFEDGIVKIQSVFDNRQNPDALNLGK